MNEYKKISLGKYNHIFLTRSKKFKSIGIRIVYKLKYDYKMISAYNILCKYLGNCNLNYPSIQQLNQYIDSLYGSSVGIKTEYIGDLFLVSFQTRFVNPKYVHDEHLIEEEIQLLHDLIYQPLLKEKSFDKSIFEICKNNCLMDSLSKNELNLNYVFFEVLKKLYGDETSSFAANPIGDEMVLNQFNEKNIVKYYQKLLHAPFDIYVSGDFAFKDMEKKLRQYFTKTKIHQFQGNLLYQTPAKHFEPILIPCDVSQASVAIAFTTSTLINTRYASAMKVLRLILSGGLSYKFFKEIRENQGLCYSISSSCLPYSATYFVYTAVDNKNVEKVVDEVKKQIQEVCNGKITDEEINAAKTLAINALRSSDDYLFGKIDYIQEANLLNTAIVFDEKIKAIEKVSKQDLIAVAKKLEFCGYGALKKG